MPKLPIPGLPPPGSLDSEALAQMRCPGYIPSLPSHLLCTVEVSDFQSTWPFWASANLEGAEVFKEVRPQAAKVFSSSRSVSSWGLQRVGCPRFQQVATEYEQIKNAGIDPQVSELAEYHGLGRTRAVAESVSKWKISCCG